MALLALLPILGYAFFIHIKFKQNISSSIFFSVTFILSVLSILGMFNLLQISSYILFYLGLILLLFFLKKHKPQIISAIKSIPFIFFILSCTLYLLLFQNAGHFFWDEYGHWGLAIKEMMQTNHIYDNLSVVGFKYYPPGSPIWQYFISINTTGYSQATTYFAHFLLISSALSIMYEKTSFKDIKWVVLIFLIQLLVLANFGHGLSSIYVDHIISILFIGIVFSALSQKYDSTNIYLFIFPILSLILVKEVGLYFAVAGIGFIFLLFLVRKWNSEFKLYFIFTKYKSMTIACVVLLLSGILILKGWNLKQENAGISKPTFGMSYTVQKLIKGESPLSIEQRETIQERFLDIFFNQQISKEEISKYFNEFSYNIMNQYKDSWRLSTFGILILYILISLAAIFIYKEQKPMLISISLYMLSITIVYIFIIYLSYFISFGTGGLRIPSYVRYINSSIFPMILFALSLFTPMFYDHFKNKVHNMSEKKALKKKHTTLFVALISITTYFYFFEPPYLKSISSPNEDRMQTLFNPITEEIIQSIPKNSEVFVIFPIKGNGGTRNKLRFMLYPLKTTFSSYDFLQQHKNKQNEFFAKYDYICTIPIVNKDTFQRYKNYSQIPKDKELFKIFKVIKKHNNISLKEVINAQ